MTEEELTPEYLSNFPTIFREALTKNSNLKQKFTRTVSKSYSDLKVYRAINYEDRIVDEDFWSYVEISINKGENFRNNLEWYSVSVNEDKNQLIANMNIPNEERHLLGIASGMMRNQYGPADFKEKKTHHNWYLYDGVISALKESFVVEKLNGDNV